MSLQSQKMTAQEVLALRSLVIVSLEIQEVAQATTLLGKTAVNHNRFAKLRHTSF